MPDQTPRRRNRSLEACSCAQLGTLPSATGPDMGRLAPASKKAKRGTVKSDSRLEKNMGPAEVKLVCDMYHVRKMKPSDIAKAMGRDKSTITRRIFKTKAYLKPGRRRLLMKKDVDRLVAKTKQMVKQADTQTEVTVEMVRKATKTKASAKTILKEFHERGFHFRYFRMKPRLTAQDRKDRKTFASLYKDKPKSFWQHRVAAYIDNKKWPVYLNAKSRKMASQRTARGAFRFRGDGLGEGYTKQDKALRVNTGARGAIIFGAIAAKGTLVWKEVAGTWNGGQAAEMYKVLKKQLAKGASRNARRTILEDNDPTGYKSAAGKAAKAEAKLATLDFPKRSPDLNPMDYGLWRAVDMRMRRQERRFGGKKVETREEYLARLKRTASNLPGDFLARLVGDMKRRCQRCFEANGGHFEEGGKPTSAQKAAK